MISYEGLEKALKKKVYWKLPNNYYTMMSSINKGIPVSEVNENSNITESFTQLASKITEDMFEQDLKSRKGKHQSEEIYSIGNYLEYIL